MPFKPGKKPNPDILKRANRLISGLFLTAAGILLLATHGSIMIPVSKMIGIVLIINSLYRLIGFCIKKNGGAFKILLAVSVAVIGVIMLASQDFSYTMLVFLFSMYLLAIAAVRAIDAFLAFQNRANEFVLSAVSSIIYLVFSALILLRPQVPEALLFLLSGIMCIIFGGIFLLDFIGSVVPQKTKKQIKSRIHIGLPVILAMFIPYTIQKRINTYLQEGYELPTPSNLDLEGEPDLIIYIHIAKKGFNAIGHCDLWFDGEIIAYGNYDEPHSTPIGTGPGVLITSNKEQYIPFCLKFNKTTIFAFGLKLSEEQKASIKASLDKIKANTYPWSPPYRYAKEHGENAVPEDFKDFPSHLDIETESKFAKFKSGRMKTYFVFTTNCVMLPNMVLGKAGAGVLDINGIISPGTLYDYLDSEYYRNGSMVISRDVYRYDDLRENKINLSKTDKK